MATLGLEVSVLVLLAVEISAQVIVVLVEEVGLTNTNPEEVGLFAEEVVDLLVAISIDVGESVWISLLLIYSCREKADVAEHVRIVDADEEAVKTTHRQTGDSTMSLIFLDTICLLDEVHDIRESSLERTLHRFGEHHRGNLEALRGLARTCLLRDVTIGHHDEHGLSLTLGNEIVEDLGGTSEFAPCVLITTDAM